MPAVDEGQMKKEEAPLRIGVDVGSTTVKLVVLDERAGAGQGGVTEPGGAGAAAEPDDTGAAEPGGTVLFSVYRRHHSDIRATFAEI